MIPRGTFELAVAGFVAYNAVVIVWELNKDQSRVCPKCAITRLAVGGLVGAWAVGRGVGALAGEAE